MKDKAQDIAYLRKVYSPLVGQKMIIPEKVLSLCEDYEKLFKSYHGLTDKIASKLKVRNENKG